MANMRAILLTGVTEAMALKFSEVDKPKTIPGWVLIENKAFGLNHSEQILRLNEISADYIRKPIIPGIECTGIIADPSDTRFRIGQRVIAFMGGMGRSFHGSYAEYVLVPVRHVFAVPDGFTWEQLGAIPETYYTAWGSLFECLQLKPEDKLLIRGATCALGYAAIQIAKALGCQVTATTHRKEKLQYLLKYEVDQAILDDGSLKNRITGVTKVLELVGPKTLSDTLRSVDTGVIVCNTGILGNVFVWNGFDPIKDIPNGVYLTGFFSNMPTQKVIDEMFAFLHQHRVNPGIGKAYQFDQLPEACMDIDTGRINGKAVVTLP